MMYFRSIYTGNCVKADFIPQFGGWEMISEETYLAWCRERGI